MATVVEVVAVVIFIALDLLLFKALYRNFMVGGSARRACAFVALRTHRAMQAMKRGVGQSQSRTPHDDEVRRQVASLVEQRSIDFARSALVGVAIMVAMRVPFLCLEILAGMYSLKPTLLFITGIAAALSALGASMPHLVHAGTLPLWHLAFMGVISIGLTPLSLDMEEAFIVMRGFSLMTSMILGLFCPKIWLLTISFTCQSACLIWNYTSCERTFQGVATIDVVNAEAWTIVWRLLFFYLMTTLFETVARQEVHARLGRGAVSSLLGMVCDAVADTDEDLRLKRHEESLCSLLMHGAGKSLEGCSLKPYMHDEDGGVCRRLGQASRAADGSFCTDMFSGRLRDSIGSAVGTHIYHVPYFDISGAVHHLIGFRENSDGRDVECLRTASEGFPEAVLSDDIATRLQSLTPNGPPSTSGSETSSVPGARTRTVDVSVADNLPMRGASERFRSEFGVDGVSGAFAEVLLRHGGEGLCAWIRERAGRVQSGLLTAPHVEAYGIVAMRGTPPAADGEEYRVSLNVGRGSSAPSAHQGTVSQAQAPAELGSLRSGRCGARVRL